MLISYVQNSEFASSVMIHSKCQFLPRPFCQVIAFTVIHTNGKSFLSVFFFETHLGKSNENKLVFVRSFGNSFQKISFQKQISFTSTIQMIESFSFVIFA